jgi:hypothetical protein
LTHNIKDMSEQITIQVSEQVLRQADYIAAKTQQTVETVIANWLESLINDIPVGSLSDEEVLALSELRLSEEQQSVLDELLVHNREGTMDAEKKQQLDELMYVYERGLLRKSQALREAVVRGLHEPLHS